MSKKNEFPLPFPPFNIPGGPQAPGAPGMQVGNLAATTEHIERDLKGRRSLIQSELAELDWEISTLDDQIKDANALLDSASAVDTLADKYASLQLSYLVRFAERRRIGLTNRRGDLGAVLVELNRQLDSLRSGVVPVLLHP